MTAQENTLFSDLATAVATLDDARVLLLTREALSARIDPLSIIENGLRPGITMVGDRYAAGDAFLPELMLAAKVMSAAIEILKPEMALESEHYLGKVVMGTVAGDLHDMGKNLVISMIELSGYEVIDLGVDVSSQKFVESVNQHHPQIIGMSSLMSTTIHEQEKVIENLTSAGYRTNVKVIVGGAAITQEWAETIGADGFCDIAAGVPQLVKDLVG
jgi:5-methyltetrahydrofolate--homocysteine methyltransferase